jgi:hypothetical protein
VTPEFLWLEAACSPLGLRVASLEAVVEFVASLTRQEGSAPARDLVPKRHFVTGNIDPPSLVQVQSHGYYDIMNHEMPDKHTVPLLCDTPRQHLPYSQHRQRVFGLEKSIVFPALSQP